MATGTEEESAPLKLPLPVHVQLTSNPKGMEDFPKEAQLDAMLTAEVGKDGKLVVKSFQ